MKCSAIACLGLLGLSSAHDVRVGSTGAYSNARVGAGRSQSHLRKHQATGSARARPAPRSAGADAPSKVQRFPCLLFEVEFEREEGAYYEWQCEVYGQDAESAGAYPGSTSAMVQIVGDIDIEEINPDIISGVTTVKVEGAMLDDHKLIIPDGEPSFDFYDNHGSRRLSEGRRLAALTGELKTLVVRVSGTDRSLSKTASQLADDIFGMHGDQINFKTMTEGCSNRKLTITPAPASGSRCVDNASWGGYRYSDGTIQNCDYFTNASWERGCQLYSDYPDQINNSGLTVTQACCFCGGGNRNGSYTAPITDGAMDVTVNMQINGQQTKTVEEAAIVAAKNRLGFSPTTVFDLVIYALPQGTISGGDQNWLAYAYMGGTISIFNEAWAMDPMTYLHEIGHNWGMGHAWFENQEYSDASGAMGHAIGGPQDDNAGSKICFNGLHSWLLGWYSEYNLEVNPSSDSFNGKLVGAGRVSSINCDEYVVLKVGNLYVMYNHAVGPNEGTDMAPNQVTIVTVRSGTTTDSDFVAALPSGGRHLISNYAGSGQSLTIEVASIDTGASGYAVVNVYLGSTTPAGKSRCGGSGPAPTTPVPVPAPTPAPVHAPTHAPVHAPTHAPVHAPNPAPVGGSGGECVDNSVWRDTDNWSCEDYWLNGICDDNWEWAVDGVGANDVCCHCIPCVDTSGDWVDTDGWSCQDYLLNGFCDDNWEWAVDGVGANDVCCQCMN